MKVPPPKSDTPAGILYVEDDEFMRGAIADYLRGHGFPTDTARNGLDGFERANRRQADSGGPYQLIITDLDMPVMNGLEFITRLRAANYAGPVIVYAGPHSLRVAEGLRACRIHAKVDKTMPAELLKAIMELEGFGPPAARDDRGASPKPPA